MPRMDWVGFAWIGLAVVLLVLLGARSGGAASRERVQMVTRLAALERKVDAIADQLGVIVPEPQHPDVVLLLQQGQKIQAIKQYRQDTGADLVTAKGAVEEIARRRSL